MKKIIEHLNEEIELLDKQQREERKMEKILDIMEKEMLEASGLGEPNKQHTEVQQEKEIKIKGIQLQILEKEKDVLCLKLYLNKLLKE